MSHEGQQAREATDGIRQPHDAQILIGDVRDLVREHTRQLAWARRRSKPSVRAIDASCFDPVAKALTTALGT
ncbi:hypothetical protein [Stenotrophomonas maltophilia]|uniref:hypothetical protein n=1 Tax=Stenotrophomonas maltophilia group TaxID=995085 RepID=UPI000DB102A8|nr:hypothetical protein A7X56_08350 [Stenotrophomonas maltophilia]